jgi:hypothetical protein
MAGGAGHVEVLERGLVVRPARDRPIAEHLAGVEQAQREVSLGGAEGLLEVLLREDHLIHDQVSEVGHDLLDLGQHPLHIEVLHLVVLAGRNVRREVVGEHRAGMGAVVGCEARIEL